MIVRFWSVLCVGILVTSVQSVHGNNDNEGTKISKFFMCIYLLCYFSLICMCFVITYVLNFAVKTKFLNEILIFFDVFHKSPNLWLIKIVRQVSWCPIFGKGFLGSGKFPKRGNIRLRSVACGCRRNRPDHFLSCMVHTFVLVTCHRPSLYLWVCGAFCR